MDIAQIQFSKLDDLKELYSQVKECILLAENFDPHHSVYLSPLNELRNVLDHVMRSFNNPSKIDEEYHEAKEHLYRAGYDAFEVLSINIGDNIVKCVEKYDVEIISIIFPYYFTDIKKHLINIKVELARVRALKKMDSPIGITNFTPYQEKITELISHLKICEENIPTLQAEKRRRKNKWLVNNLWGIIVGLIIGIVGLYLYDNYFKNEPVKTIVTTPLKK